MAYKTDKLKERIKEKYGTQRALCKALDIEPSTLSRYLSGRDWKGSTLIRVAKALEIPEGQLDSYFFAPEVAKKELKGAKK